MNVGVGTLATAKRPANVSLKPLMRYYADGQRDTFALGDEVRDPSSALLPMGGAVSGVAGPNWLLVGDAAACVNPLNGEGIDYGLETGRFAADLIATGDRPDAGLARAAAGALRDVVQHRPAPGRPHHRARAAGPARARSGCGRGR